MLYTQLKAPLTLINTILAHILPRLFKSCLKKIPRRARNDLARCESTSTRPLQGMYYTLQIYSFSAILTFSRNLCAKEWVEQHHGTVEEFAAYFSALPPDELEVCSSKISQCLSEFTFHLALQGPFQVPHKQASRLSLLMGSRGIRDVLFI